MPTEPHGPFLLVIDRCLRHLPGYTYCGTREPPGSRQGQAVEPVPSVNESLLVFDQVGATSSVEFQSQQRHQDWRSQCIAACVITSINGRGGDMPRS